MTLKVLVPLDVIDAHHPALQSARQFLPQAELHVLASPAFVRPYGP